MLGRAGRSAEKGQPQGRPCAARQNGTNAIGDEVEGGADVRVVARRRAVFLVEARTMTSRIPFGYARRCCGRNA